jgi:PAS domain S-box-containing protein
MAQVKQRKAERTDLLTRLLPLRRIFAHAAIGDFSQDVVVPEADEELAEVYMGVHVMLNVIRHTIIELQTANLNLQNQIDNLAAAQAKDEALLASIGEGIIATDEVGNIIRFNHIAAQLLGLSPNLVIGQPLDQVLILTDAIGTPVPKHQRPYWRALQTGQRIVATNLSVYYRRGDGSLMPMAITASPIRLGDKVIGVMNVWRDLSREKAVDRSKSDFLTVASHQLKTPLTMINWHTQRLLNSQPQGLSPSQKLCLTDIQAGVTRLNAMCNAVLTVSELQLGTICATCGQTPLQPLLAQVVQEAEKQAQAKAITVSQKVLSDLPPVSVDPKLLQTVLGALVNNALTYTPTQGQITVQAEFMGHRDQAESPTAQGKVIVKISDTGIGIPLHQQGSIFTKLFRADNAKILEPGGTGLSLFIAKGVMELMQGEIWFDSQEGEGSTFFIALPVSAQV